MIASKSKCQLCTNHRFIPRSLRECHENPNQSYVRTPRNAVKGEGPLQRARKQSDPDPQWDLSFVLWKIEIGSIKRKRNCDLCDLSCILWKIKIGSIKCKRNCDPCDLSCISRKLGKPPDLLTGSIKRKRNCDLWDLTAVFQGNWASLLI